ncbi:hypothetical protein EON80_12780 [bacterium]|nr:MAG: hypothetical protein EON80_12780 [bacterium]
MSYLVYGFIQTCTSSAEFQADLGSLVEQQLLGMREISAEDLHGFPPEHLPSDLSHTVLFEITSAKEGWGAEYLLSHLDFAPEVEIGLPLGAKARQALLISLLEAMAALPGTEKIYVTINDCNQIEEVKFVSLKDFGPVARADFTEEMPPDVLYIISNCVDSEWREETIRP